MVRGSPESLTISVKLSVLSRNCWLTTISHIPPWTLYLRTGQPFWLQLLSQLCHVSLDDAYLLSTMTLLTRHSLVALSQLLLFLDGLDKNPLSGLRAEHFRWWARSPGDWAEVPWDSWKEVVVPGTVPVALLSSALCTRLCCQEVNWVKSSTVKMSL